jgi:uncharacterized membrane protein YgcG
MKYLLSAAVLAFSAIVGSLAAVPPPPLACNMLTPVKGDVWEMGKLQTVTWGCKTAGPLETQPNKFLMHIELGTGTPTNFVYVDTFDDAAELKLAKFTWLLLTKYTPGENYIVRLRSRTKGDPNPVTADEANKLPWSYSPNIKLVGAGGAASTTTGNTATNNTTSSSTSGSSTSGSSTGGSSTGGSSTGGSSTGGSSTGGSANNSTKSSTANGKSAAGIVSVNVGVFFTTVMATLVAAAFL